MYVYTQYTGGSQRTTSGFWGVRLRSSSLAISAFISHFDSTTCTLKKKKKLFFLSCIWVSGVCAHMYIDVHICMVVHVCCLWRPEMDVGSLPSSFSTSLLH